ncbi:MAG: hypothetical protein RIK87_00040 [Fuerstiella sp.]
MKYAYLILVVAAVAAGAEIFVDVTAQPSKTETAAGDTRADQSTGPSVASGSLAVQLDPGVEKRIQEILNRDESGASSTAPASDTQSSADSPEEVSDPGIVTAAASASVSASAPAAAPISASAFPATGGSAPIESVTTSIGTASPTTTPTAGGHPPIRQQTPLHSQMVTPGNFEYLGAFRLPHQSQENQKFSYGGWGLTYRADGDTDRAADRYPGSLFIGGHRHFGLVSEIDIPAPVISPDRNMDDLPVASVLQPAADITGGIRDAMTNGASEPFEIGGLQVVNDQLHWTLYKYYNVEGVDYPSHGISSTRLSRPMAQGLWHLGPERTGDPRWHSYKHAGYICEIPQTIADQYLGGRNLMSGLQISTGHQTSSHGPAFFAYRLPETSPRVNPVIDAVPLLWYPMNRQIPGHHYADRWTGAAWLTLGDRHTVIVAGRKALGPVYYGPARPGDCYPDKGYHGSAYETQLLFYAPGALLEASRAAVPIVDPWYRWDSNTPGGGIDRFTFRECAKDIGGLAYDRDRNLLYMSEVDAGHTSDNEWEPLPVIHVFRLVDD